MSAETKKVLHTNAHYDVSSHIPWHMTAEEAKKLLGKSTFDGPIPLAKVKSLLKRAEVTSIVLPPLFVQNAKGVDVPVAGIDNRQMIVSMLDGPHWLTDAGAESRTVRQYADLFVDQLGEWVGESPAELHYRSVGILRNGGRAYAQITTGGLQLVEGYAHFPHVYVGMGQDGSLAIESGAGTTAIVCDNTFAAARSEAEGNGTRISIRQTKNAAERITAASLTVALEQQNELFESWARGLMGTPVTPEHWQAFATLKFPGSEKLTGQTRAANNIEKLTGIYNGDERVTPWAGTAFAVIQAANVFDLWERGTRGETNKAERIFDDMLSGKLATAEDHNESILQKVLATV